MRIDAPFTIRPADSLRSGELALISDGKRLVYMLAVTFEGGSTSTLILEGDHAGQFNGEAPSKVTAFKAPPTLRVPLNSADWTSDVSPSAPLNVAFDGSTYNFVFGGNVRPLTAVNIETGMVTKPPHRALYTSQWFLDYINIDGIPVQFVQSSAG